jgi:hypothetical protein
LGCWAAAGAVGVWTRHVGGFLFKILSVGPVCLLAITKPSPQKTFFFSSFLFFPINFYYPQLELNHLKNIPFPVSYFFFLFRNRGRGKSQFLFSFKF